MDRLKELRMSLIIIVIGVFFLSGCFFNSKNMVTFKTNGGSSVEPISVKSGNKIEEPDTPTKDGYVFDGWYLDGEEYDFDESVDEDITLVAKWSKIEVTDESGDAIEDTDETTTTTTKVTTTKKTSTTKKTTTTKKVSSSSTVNSSNVGSGTSTAKSSTTVSTTSTSSSSTTSTTGILPTSTSMVVTTTSTTVPTTTVARLKIEKTIEEDETETVKISYGVTDEESNVVTNISPVTLEKLINANRTTYKVVDNNGNEYTGDNNVYTENLLTLKGFKNVNTLAVTYVDKDTNQESNLPVLIELVDDKWYINDVTVTAHLTEGLSNIKYYSSLSNALDDAKDSETIDLLTDVTLDEALNINTGITIDGNSHKITSTADYMFIIPKKFESSIEEITFKNFEINCKTMIKVNSDDVKKIEFNKINGYATNYTIDPKEKENLINLIDSVIKQELDV